jgi:amino acid transporter
MKKKFLSYLSVFSTFTVSALLFAPSVLAQNFNDYNPLIQARDTNAPPLNTPGAIVNRFLEYAFPAAGLILFVMIVWGGFEMMTSSVGSKKNAGKERIQAAVLGFLLLFASYWLAQLIQVIFGVKFLG